MLDKSRKILIIGAAGGLARILTNILSKANPEDQIIGVDSRPQAEEFERENVQFLKIKYTRGNFEKLFRDNEFHAVYHLARMSHAYSNKSNLAQRLDLNIMGTNRILELALKFDVKKMIILSTYHVYGASPYNPALIEETAPLKAAELTMDLVDSVELENLANIYLWRYPDLNITILRPCNIVGPGVRNTISSLLSSRFAPNLMGFSPIMQFIHIDDMADAVSLAHKKRRRGVYNVATSDWIAYQEALEYCGCTAISIPSIPPILPRAITGLLNLKMFPSYLVNYFKYPVVINGENFNKTFGFKAKRPLKEIFRSYREDKE